MQSLGSFKVDHLFLLVGENPLPNYIAAINLLRHQGTVYLVHTTFTQVQAQRLKQLLLQELTATQTVQFISLAEYRSNAYQIRQRIQATVHPLDGSIGMNYTGGTKAMAVHAYRALQDIRPDAIFSYLDPHSLSMRFDHDDQDSVSVRLNTTLSLSQIFRLHGLHWRSGQQPLTAPVQPAAAAALAHCHQDPQLAKAWRDWCDQELRDKAIQNWRWRSENELIQLPPLSLKRVPTPIKSILCQYLDASMEQLSLKITCKGRFNSLRQVCDWLNGIWLEHYVLHQVQQIASTCSIHDSRMSFRIQDPEKPYQSWDKFEFDVAFMREYQLFALSCTTTHYRKLCKQKLFEAFLRARQLGGAEARVGLVCCNSDPQGIKAELEVVTRNRKLAVFGRQDLGDLGQKIKDWIAEND